VHAADQRSAAEIDEQASDARLVIPMKWLPADRAEVHRVIDIDAAPPEPAAFAAESDIDPGPDFVPRNRTPAARLSFVTVPDPDAIVAPSADATVPTALAGWAHVISTSPDACLLVDARGRVLAASFAAAELLGDVTPDEMVGRHLLDGILHFADFDAGKRGHDRGPAYADRIPPLLAVATEAPARGLLRITSRSGDIRMVDALAAPVHDPSGVVLGAVSFVHAISFD
jgi:PAS domain S-box-containing protein